MERNEALKLWIKEKGNKEYSYDFAGRKIKKTDYLANNQVGWTVGLIRPSAAGGRNYDGNTIIMHHTTAEEKGSSYPFFTSLDKSFAIRYDEKEDFYYIEKLLTDDYDESGFI